MSEERYFVIRNSDGDTYVETLSKAELDKRLKPKDGEHYYGLSSVLDAVPEDSDTNYWGGNLLIIKGHVVGANCE